MHSLSDIADVLQTTSKLLELHDGNQFKIRGLAGAAFKLSKLHIPEGEFTEEGIIKHGGVGKAMAKTVMEIAQKGTSSELTELLEKTPAGVIEMMNIKGLGPKKVKQLWHELEIDSVGALLYACHENRLVTLKGFGEKTQRAVIESIEFLKGASGKSHFANVEELADGFVEELKELQYVSNISLTGAIYRKDQTLDGIDILIAADEVFENEFASPIPVNLIFTTEEEFYYELIRTSSTEEHLKKINFDSLTDKNFISEEEVYEALGQPYFLPEWRDGLFEEIVIKKYPQNVIEEKHLKGILHNHSTYSDGANTLSEMANYCKELGYEYFGIADHSKSATYAGGLKEEDIFRQHAEIDKLNKELAPFKILKGTECDILFDGSLDYDNDILKTFDYVVASIHQHFKMDEEKATARLIKAIENPHTTILGHPTGRLLLARPGYPINHKKVIDACAANNVIMELNSHPYRLDIDWAWIPYCLEKGVKISINPDAHEKNGFHDMHFGVSVARKGLLTKDFCFNALSLSEIEKFLSQTKPR
ncbi:MAG: PHP domain-containing protein [Bacteroidia bacterium]